MELGVGQFIDFQSQNAAGGRFAMRLCMKIMGKRLTVLRLSLNKHALAHSVMLLGETKNLLQNISTIDILERKIFKIR